ncbi:MAG: hypothetical protein LUE93_04015 [Bacteroides sp.]|nr:hypothetical protein [Bacteroides sp.]
MITQLNQNPQAIVKVTLDNGKVATLTVTQEEVKYVPLYAQSFRPDLPGNWSSALHYDPFGKWADEMRNSGNFGPGGTVYTLSPVDVSRSGWTELKIGSDGVRPRILNMNNTMYIPAVTNIVTSVKNDENTVFIIYEWTTSNNTFRNFGLGGVYTPAGPTTIPRTTPRRLNTDPSVRSTELWKYIFEEGPFGEVNPENVVLYPQDYPNYMAYLTKWPSTFISLMFAPDANGQPNTGRALLGVDPTNRIIWIGHKDMFGTDASSYTNWGNSDNLKFLQNLIAWMVHVNNYGDAFNDRFKVGSN